MRGRRQSDVGRHIKKHKNPQLYAFVQLHGKNYTGLALFRIETIKILIKVYWKKLIGQKLISGW